MKRYFLSFLLSTFVFEVSYAHDLSLNYDKDVSTASKKILEYTMEEVSTLLPLTFKMRAMLWMMPNAFKKQSVQYMTDFKNFAENGKSVTNATT